MIFLSSCVLVYSLLLTPSIDSKWVNPSWKKMIPVRGYVQLNNRVFNLSDPIQVPQTIAKKLISKIHQTLSIDQVQSSPVDSTPAEPAQAPAQAPVLADPSVQSPAVVEPAQAPVPTPLAEPQEPASESIQSELAQAPVVEVSSTSTTTTTTTTTTTPAPTTLSTTTSTAAPRVAPSKTYVAPTKTHSVVQTQVVKEEAVKSPTKTSIKSPSKTSAPKSVPTKTSDYSTKQVVQSPSRYVSPVKTARGLAQTNY